MEYDLTIKHRPGLANANADALSRLPQQAQIALGRAPNALEIDFPEQLYSTELPESQVVFADSDTPGGAYYKALR